MKSAGYELQNKSGTDETCKTKWNNMMAKYKKYAKKLDLPTGSGADDTPTDKPEFYDEMQEIMGMTRSYIFFLVKYLKYYFLGEAHQVHPRYVGDSLHVQQDPSKFQQNSKTTAALSTQGTYRNKNQNYKEGYFMFTFLFKGEKDARQSSSTDTNSQQITEGEKKFNHKKLC